MANQAPAQQVVREEERVLGISFDRAIAMVPKLIREATGAEPDTLGDGYFVATVNKDGRAREVTVRLGRQGPDTRFSVRVESYAATKMIAIAVIIGVVTMGIGMLAMLPWMIKLQRQEARERDLLVHKTFRAIEDAVAEQGAATNYRVAPGADAAVPARTEPLTEPLAEPLTEPVTEEAQVSAASAVRRPTA